VASSECGWRKAATVVGAWIALAMVLLGACGRNSLPDAPFGCLEYESVCAGVCTDTSNSSEHCGGCGNLCSTNEECIASKCRPLCSAGETLCAAGCIDVQRDREHCGGCKNACALGDVCVDGACRAVVCTGVHVPCEGACVNPENDPAHCGGCFTKCEEGWSCAGGKCRSTCPGTLCGVECVDTGSDPSHCGSCGFSCGAGESCVMGQCVLICPAGSIACGNSCVDPSSDERHCGACFTVCRGSCSRGTCQPACAAPKVGCGDNCVDPRVDRSHCGGCDIRCAEGLECRQGRCLPPSETCDWSTVQFPFQIEGSLRIGDLTVDQDCTLYVALAHEYYDLGALYSISYDSGEVELVRQFSDQIYRVAYRAEDDSLYLASFERVYRMAKDGSSGGVLTDEVLAPYLTSLSLIPEGWGSFGGHLLIGNSDGDLIALDPSAPSPVAVATLPEAIVGLAFAGSTLYVAGSPLPFDTADGRVYQVSPTGDVTAVVDLPCGPTALASDAGTTLYVACSYGAGIRQLALPGGATSAIYAVDLYPYWGPGLLWDNGAFITFSNGQSANVTIDVYFP
jgi:hypothetical protein